MTVIIGKARRIIGIIWPMLQKFSSELTSPGIDLRAVFSRSDPHIIATTSQYIYENLVAALSVQIDLTSRSRDEYRSNVSRPTRKMANRGRYNRACLQLMDGLSAPDQLCALDSQARNTLLILRRIFILTHLDVVWFSLTARTTKLMARIAIEKTTEPVALPPNAFPVIRPVDLFITVSKNKCFSSRRTSSLSVERTHP
jgi:hypothetical protein